MAAKVKVARRIWSTAAVVSTFILLLLIVAWIVSTRYFLAAERRSFDAAQNRDRGFVIICVAGDINIEHWLQHYAGIAPPPRAIRWGFQMERRVGPYWPITHGWWVGLRHRIVVRIPLLVMFAAILPASRLPALVARFRASFRRKRGLCPNCGYDVRATPAQCPECGQRIDHATNADSE